MSSLPAFTERFRHKVYRLWVDFYLSKCYHLTGRSEAKAGIHVSAPRLTQIPLR